MKAALNLCGMGESDSHFEFGKLACYHYTNPASEEEYTESSFCGNLSS